LFPQTTHQFGLEPPQLTELLTLHPSTKQSVSHSLAPIQMQETQSPFNPDLFLKDLLSPLKAEATQEQEPSLLPPVFPPPSLHASNAMITTTLLLDKDAFPSNLLDLAVILTLLLQFSMEFLLICLSNVEQPSNLHPL
jgi:hypothetical protein